MTPWGKGLFDERGVEKVFLFMDVQFLESSFLEDG